MRVASDPSGRSLNVKRTATEIQKSIYKNQNSLPWVCNSTVLEIF